MNPSTLIFLGLAVVWAVVLLPEVIRKLSGARSSDSIRSFNQQLSVLHRSDNRRGSELPGTVRALQGSRSNVIDLRNRTGATGPVAAPATPRPVSLAVRKRRQEVLAVLGASAVLSLVLTVAFGGVLFLGLLLVSGVLLVAYVAALAQLNQAPRTAATLTMHNSLSGHAPALSDGLRTATVGRATPAPRRIAN